jgi:hypothetical protein
LRDELRELASMQFWRAAVAPWMRPVHLTIVVSENVIQGTTVRGRCAPGEVLVSYGFPEVNPGSSVWPSPPFFIPGGEADAARAQSVDWLGTPSFSWSRKRLIGLAPRAVFVTRGLHATWSPPTVFGSDLSLGFGATNRADKLFECVSTARLVLKVFALPRESSVAEWTA